MLPSAGQGAINAMQDAVILANCIYDLKDNSLPSLTLVLQSFYEQRFGPAKTNYKDSQTISKVMIGQTWSDRLLRTLTLSYLPQAVQQRHYIKSVAYRPQIMFLPLIENKGQIRPKYQKPCQRKPLQSYLREEEEDPIRKGKPTTATTTTLMPSSAATSSAAGPSLKDGAEEEKSQKEAQPQQYQHQVATASAVLDSETDTESQGHEEVLKKEGMGREVIEVEAIAAAVAVV